MLNTFCPGRGSNQDLLRGSQTLYRVAIKAGLYRKAVQVYIIPNIATYSPSILDSFPESQLDILRIYFLHGCAPSHRMGYFTLVARCNRGKMLNTFCPDRGSNQDLLRDSQTLYCVAIKAGLYRKAVQVYSIPNITTCSLRVIFD